MLEIIALYFLFREAGRLALEKGYSPLRWKLTVLFTWFMGELTGVYLVQLIFPGQLYIMLIIGVCMAYLFYLLLKQYWMTLPDKSDDYED